MLPRNAKCVSDPRLIGLYGYPGSGKDAVARILMRRYGWNRISFADPIREMLLAMDPYIHEPFMPSLKLSEVVAYCGSIEVAKRDYRDVRRLLQRLGTEAGRNILGNDVWVDIAKRKILALPQAVGNVITDLRFANEYQMVQDMGGVIVKVDRPGCEGFNHPSEQHYEEFWPDYVIMNNGGLDLLTESVETLIEALSTQSK